MRAREVRVDADGLPMPVDRAVEVSLEPQRLADVVRHLGKVGPQAHRLAIGGDRFVEAAGMGLSDAQVAPGLGVIRQDPDRFAEHGFGLGRRHHLEERSRPERAGRRTWPVTAERIGHLARHRRVAGVIGRMGQLLEVQRAGRPRLVDGPPELRDGFTERSPPAEVALLKQPLALDERVDRARLGRSVALERRGPRLVAERPHRVRAQDRGRPQPAQHSLVFVEDPEGFLRPLPVEQHLRQSGDGFGRSSLHRRRLPVDRDRAIRRALAELVRGAATRSSFCSSSARRRAASSFSRLSIVFVASAAMAGSATSAITSRPGLGGLAARPAAQPPDRTEPPRGDRAPAANAARSLAIASAVS